MKNDFEQWAEERRRRLAERRARRARQPEPGPGAEEARRRRAGPAEDAGAGEGEDPGASRFGRKEKVLHTRISEKLDEALRRASEELRVPVSNLVRNVLEDVFTVVDAVAESVEDFVEDVVDETSEARERLFGTSWRKRQSERRRRADASRTDDEDLGSAPERAEFPDVLGWQALLLNAPQTCADCEEPLAKGTRAYLGIPASGPPKTYLCRDCMEARSSADDESGV
jgi:hypothetical protein